MKRRRPSQPKKPKKEKKMDMMKQSIVANQTAFALRLAGHLAKTAASDANLAVSPLSIHLVLGLIAAGSQGATLDQILSVVGSASASELNDLSSKVVSLVLAYASATGGTRLNFANGVWVDASLSLKPSFHEMVTLAYKAEAKAVDFQTKAEGVRDEVNSWVKNITSGLIDELLPVGSVDQDTRLIMGNALYFKGAWAKSYFDASKTKESDFHLLDGSSVRVPFMTNNNEEHSLYFFAHDGFKELSLPYKRGVVDCRRFSMCIYLPDAKDGLWGLIDRLSSDPGIVDRPRVVEVNKLKLPKFKISFGFNATQAVKNLGLFLPFTTMDGGLTEMVGSSSLCVSSIFHKSVVEVNEEGTEAAAAAGACIAQMSLGSPPLDFEADHPFAYMIREYESGVVLFVGHVLNPLLPAA